MTEPTLLRLFSRVLFRKLICRKSEADDYLNLRDRLWWKYKRGAFKKGDSATTALGNFQVHFRRFEDLMRVLEEIWGVESYAFETSKKDPIIFDLGANIGISALYFKKHYPLASLHAFEPDPANFKVLQENISINHLRNVELHPLAVSDKVGDLEFFTNEESLVSSAYGTRVEQTTQAKSYRVRSACLSSFISQEIDFLKMDIEGSEWEVLHELAASGKLKNIRQMAIEYHHHLEPGQDRLADFLRILETHGFTYCLSAPFLKDSRGDDFQDILIRARRL